MTCQSSFSLYTAELECSLGLSRGFALLSKVKSGVYLTAQAQAAGPSSKREESCDIII